MSTRREERLFLEERRRLKIIPNAFGEKAVLKLMFAAMTRAAERWRSIRITAFERRQMDALHKDLDQDYEAAVDPLDPEEARLVRIAIEPARRGLSIVERLSALHSELAARVGKRRTRRS